jgi:hypothetical protein
MIPGNLLGKGAQSSPPFLAHCGVFGAGIFSRISAAVSVIKKELLAERIPRKALQAAFFITETYSRFSHRFTLPWAGERG